MRSPWVDARRDEIRFALQVFPREPQTNRSKALVRIGQLAESLGFDAFFVGDHPARGPECWIQLAAIAATTTRNGLGVNESSVGDRHPLLTARLAADLGELSDGRAILGLGLGWQILAADDTKLAVKKAYYFPEGIDQRFSGLWQGLAVAETPDQAVARYQALVDAGIQYFIVELTDATDDETVRLLAEHVIPQVKVIGGNHG